MKNYKIIHRNLLIKHRKILDTTGCLGYNSL